MQLADLRLAVRPRTPYEAMDLGIRLVQSEARLLWRAWFAVTLPVFLLLAAIGIAFDSKSLSLLLWWLKPLFDVALLGVLSRRVFGETPSLRATWGLVAGHWKALPGHLTWRRLSTQRAYLLPVWLLENLPPGERGARLELLRKQYAGRASWLHIAMAHFEGFLMVAVLSLLFWFVPERHMPDLWGLLSPEQSSPLSNTIGLVAYYIAMSVVEPFYVAAGFALYLNRRTELEAWDLELAFRHLRERLDMTGGRP